MLCSRLMVSLCVFVAGTGLCLMATGGSDLVRAAEQSTAADTAQLAPAELKARWAELKAEKAKFEARAGEIRDQFAKATPIDKQKLRNEFLQMLEQYQSGPAAEMSTVAAAVFALDPQDTEAGEFVLESAYEQNRYEDVVNVGTALAAAGVKSPAVATMTAISKFATHDFEGADAAFRDARAAGLLDARMAGPYLESLADYQRYWAREKQLRAKADSAQGEQQLPRVQLTTNRGPIVIELFEDEAPNTVANFISLIESGTYDNVKFHRVIPNFMVQGGDPLSKDDDPRNDGQGGPGYLIPCECYSKSARMHFRGSLSAAHAGKDTGGSQFFITHLPTPHLNPNPAQETGHTVFGRVLSGMEVVAAIEKDDVIEQAVVLNKRDHEYKPKTLPDRRRR